MGVLVGAAVVVVAVPGEVVVTGLARVVVEDVVVVGTAVVVAGKAGVVGVTDA